MRFGRAWIVFLFLGAAIAARAQEYFISTLAGGAPPPTPVPAVKMPIGPVQQLSFPMDVAVDDAGNLFIADNLRVRKVSPDGIITTIAGNGIVGYSGDGGRATRASFSGASALALDGAGNVYVADTGNNAIRILRPAAAPRKMPRY